MVEFANMDVSDSAVSKLLVTTSDQDSTHSDQNGEESDHSSRLLSHRVDDDVNRSFSSGSRFELEDSGTTDALNRCNRLLHGYKTCLKVIGWYNFVESPSIKMMLLRGLWISAIFLFILITLGTQTMSCFRRDLFRSIDTKNETFTCGEDIDTDRVILCDTDFVSIFVIPALLLLVTYIYGIYLFWGKQEDLEKLAEQVYMYLRGEDRLDLKTYVVKKIILYFVLGILYIFISLIVRICHFVVFKMLSNDVAICWKYFEHQITGTEKTTLLIVSIIGFVFHDGVYVAAVMNYAIQSELNISLLTFICVKVKNKRYNKFDTAIKDIDEAYKSVKILNGKTATLVALVLFNFVSNAIEGMIALGDSSYKEAKPIAVLTVSAVLWFFLGLFPFIQATRVTKTCTDLLAVGSAIRARPYEYKDTLQPDFDSFCIYLSSVVNMRAEIFGIPIFPWMVYMAAIIFVFAMLLLCQNGVYQYAKWM